MGLFNNDDDNNRRAILKELDDFNTAPSFGMMGILEEQMGEESQVPQPEEKEDKEEPKKEEKEDLGKFYEPLNTSIQELSAKVDNRLNAVERHVTEVKNLSTQRPIEQTAPDYDPEEPVTRGQYEQRVKNIERFAYETALNNEFTKAQLRLAQFKLNNPECKITPQELEQTWQSGIGQDLQKARSVNWDSLFYQTHHAQQAPVQQRELERLRKIEKEYEELKKGQSKPARQQTKSEPISPATARTSQRSIESPTNYTDADDITHLPSFAKGKSFKSYAKDVMRLKGIRV